MRPRVAIGVVALMLGLGACTAPEPAVPVRDGWWPVVDPALFYNLAAGRRLVAGPDHLVFLNDGRLEGFYEGAPLSGRWRWDEDRLCRTARLGERQLHPDCQLVAHDGAGRIRIVREEGRGSTVVYSIE